MHFRVGIEREPIADERQPVGEVECPKMRAWVGGTELYRNVGGGSRAKETP
jgi:hypothetical protein